MRPFQHRAFQRRLQQKLNLDFLSGLGELCGKAIGWKSALVGQS